MPVAPILPDSLGDCRLVLPTGEWLDFQQPSSLAWINGDQRDVAQWVYDQKSRNEAEIRLTPVGSALGRANFCGATHKIRQEGGYTMAGSEQSHLLVHLLSDTATMSPCTNVWGQRFTPEVGAGPVPAALVCKRESVAPLAPRGVLTGTVEPVRDWRLAF